MELQRQVARRVDEWIHEQTTTTLQPYNAKSTAAHPYKAPKKVYNAASQDPIVPDDIAKLADEQINLIQQVIGVCLNYGRAVDDIILPVLSAIVSEQLNDTR